jgi:hypothetical protein
VADASRAVAGTTVPCLGKKGNTSAAGQVKLDFPKSTPTGKHDCTATKAGYSAAKTTIKVT